MFHQLKGDHTVDQWQDLEVDWQYVFSQARRNEPDRRTYRYDYEESIDDFILSNRPSGNSRLWSDLVDNSHDAGASARLPFEVWQGLEASAEVGLNAVRKDRVVDTRRFKFFSSSSDYDVFRQRPEEVFSDENIGPDSIFTLKEITRDSDNYRGSQTLLAGYAMAELPIVEDLRVNAGARVEYSNQRVETYALFGDTESVGQLKKTDILPAVNATWGFNEEMQVRAAFARTVNRPNFRELSDSRFSNVVGGREFQGNPDLDRALINHVDARWEWYPGRGESLSVGVFGKKFQQPIELTYQSGATPVISPANVEGATNLGVELQGRTRLDFLGKAMRDFEVAGNVSLIQSQINIDPDSEKAEILTDTERPLQGQSPYVINAQFGYDNVDTRTNVTLLYNVYGPRISEVGVYGIPNVVEQPFHTLDVTFAKSFENGLKMSAKAKNLFNLAHRYTQGGEPTHVEYKGRAFSLGVSYSY
jgi:TonB-dependent receptor